MSLRLILFVLALLVILYIVWDHKRKESHKNRYRKNLLDSTMDDNISDSNTVPSLKNSNPRLRRDVVSELERDIEREVFSKSHTKAHSNKTIDSPFSNNEQFDFEHSQQVQHDIEPDEFEHSIDFDAEFELAKTNEFNNLSNSNFMQDDVDSMPPSTIRRIEPSHSSENTSTNIQASAELTNEQFEEDFNRNHFLQTNEPITDEFETMQFAPEEKTLSNTNIETSQRVSTTANEDEDISPNEIFSFHVKAKGNSDLKGEDLLQALLSVGCRLGNMNIFHRHEQASGHGDILFSVASMLKPGTFDIERMHDLKTPGVVMFFTFKDAHNPLAVYDLMLKTAYQLAKFLNADVLDENRELLTTEKASSLRQQIEDLQISEFF